jgi:hypothetical protein
VKLVRATTPLLRAGGTTTLGYDSMRWKDARFQGQLHMCITISSIKIDFPSSDNFSLNSFWSQVLEFEENFL